MFETCSTIRVRDRRCRRAHSPTHSRRAEARWPWHKNANIHVCDMCPRHSQTQADIRITEQPRLKPIKKTTHPNSNWLTLCYVWAWRFGPVADTQDTHNMPYRFRENHIAKRNRVTCNPEVHTNTFQRKYLSCQGRKPTTAIQTYPYKCITPYCRTAVLLAILCH